MLASLTRRVEFTNLHNQTIILERYEMIYVDLVESIAYFDGQAFDIFHFEYRLIN